MTNDYSESNLLLIDSSLTFSDYSDFVTSSKIIALDFDSHKDLTDKNIPHEISDTFLNSHIFTDIENQIFHFVNWYKIKEISEIISDEGINLGELFYIEFRSELTKFLKYFLEISKIIQIYDGHYFQSSKKINEIVSLISKNYKIIYSKKNEESIYSTVDIPIQLGPKKFTVTLNQKNTSKIKNFLDLSTQNFLNKKINKNFKTILLVGFTTLKTENFLLSANKYNLNLIKYDPDIPSIWNKKTFDIIRNSKSIVENQFTLSDKNEIENKKKLFEKKFDFIFLQNKIFNDYFSINGQSFWNAFKPIFKKLCNNYFSRAAKEIILAEKLFQKYSFSKILFFNESEMTEQIILNFARKNKVPTYQIQHGVYYDTPEMKLENKFGRIIPLKSDYLIVWGEIWKNYLIKNMVNPEKIHKFGTFFFEKLSPTYDSLITNQILLASDPLAFSRSIDLSFEQKILYEDTIKKISQTVIQNNQKLIIKTHPQKNQFEKEIAHQIDSSIKVNYSGDIHSMIQSSDLVITTDLTTVILESMILQKPVISIRMKEHYGKPEIFNFCNQIPLDSLDSWIKSFYSKPKIKNDLIEKGNEFLKKYISNQENSSKKLLEFLQ